MSAPDYRTNLSAFFKQMHESGAFGDHTAFVRYSYDGHTIVIEDIDVFEVFETADSDRMFRGYRPSIADLVARIDKKRCRWCDAGLVQVGNFETGLASTQVCTRCDGFSTQRQRPIRPRA